MSLLPVEFYDQLFDYGKKSHIRCDVYEENDNFVIKADIVGAKKSDLSLTSKEGYLTISVKREKEEVRKYLLHERQYNDEERSIYLGRVDEDNIDASFEEGVLTIIVPKYKDNNKNINVN